MAGHTETMDTTYADIEDGKRHDIAVEFITRRAIDCDGEHVHRLLVADQSGKQFTVLATPDSEALLLGLKTGATHRISGLLGPPLSPADDIGAECPDCGDGFDWDRSSTQLEQPSRKPRHSSPSTNRSGSSMPERPSVAFARGPLARRRLDADGRRQAGHPTRLRL